MNYYLGFLNALPLSIFMWILVLFLWITRQIDRVDENSKKMFIIDLKDNGWFFRKTFEERGFVAFGFGNVILVKDIEQARKNRILKHEAEHCLQCYKLSLFFPILYVLDSARIYFFIKDQHPYYDNVFEIQARAAANQQLVIPKSQWKLDRTFFW